MSKYETTATTPNEDFLEFCKLNQNNPDFPKNMSEIKKQNPLQQTVTASEKTFMWAMLIATIYSIVYTIFMFFAVSSVTNKFIGLLAAPLTILLPAYLKKTNFIKNKPTLHMLLTTIATPLFLLFVSPNQFIPLVIISVCLCFIKKAQKYSATITSYILAEFLMPTQFAIALSLIVHVAFYFYYKFVSKAVLQYVTEHEDTFTN